MRVRKLDDLNPDGIDITVNWDAFKVGMSFFIPCIDTDKAQDQVRKVAATKKMEISTQVRIEDKKLGLRVWRNV